jgi:hypothetical protein
MHSRASSSEELAHQASSASCGSPGIIGKLLAERGVKLAHQASSANFGSWHRQQTTLTRHHQPASLTRHHQQASLMKHHQQSFAQASSTSYVAERIIKQTSLAGIIERAGSSEHHQQSFGSQKHRQQALARASSEASAHQIINKLRLTRASTSFAHQGINKLHHQIHPQASKPRPQAAPGPTTIEVPVVSFHPPPTILCAKVLTEPSRITTVHLARDH